MGDPALYLALGAFLLLAAFLATAAGAYFGLDRVSRARLEHESEEDDDQDFLAQVMKAPRTLRGALDILADLTRIGFALCAWALSSSLLPPDTLGPVPHLLATIGAAYLALFFVGELVPRSLATRHAESVTRGLGRPLRLLLALTAPVRSLANLLVPTRLASGSPSPVSPGAEGSSGIDEEEFRELVDESTEAGVVGQAEQALIHKILDFGDRRVREVMTPFDRVFSVPDEASVAEVAQLAAERKYSRIPVYRRDPRKIAGVLYAKDLLAIRWGVASPKPLKVLLRRPLYVVPQMRAQALLESFKRHRLHMAVVVDERGDAVGLCTMEDLLEELVGPITDVAAERKGEEGPVT